MREPEKVRTMHKGEVKNGIIVYDDHSPWTVKLKGSFQYWINPRISGTPSEWTIKKDNEGQVVIYTNYYLDPSNE